MSDRWHRSTVYRELKRTQSETYIENDRTMLPLRYVAEAIGAKVEWNQATRTASFTKDGIRADIQIDGNVIVLSTGETIQLTTKPANIEGRIFISLTNISKLFKLTNGYLDDGITQDIEWDKVNRKVIVTVAK